MSEEGKKKKVLDRYQISEETTPAKYESGSLRGFGKQKMADLRKLFEEGKEFDIAQLDKMSETERKRVLELRKKFEEEKAVEEAKKAKIIKEIPKDKVKAVTKGIESKPMEIDKPEKKEPKKKETKTVTPVVKEKIIKDKKPEVKKEKKIEKKDTTVPTKKVVPKAVAPVVKEKIIKDKKPEAKAAKVPKPTITPMEIDKPEKKEPKKISTKTEPVVKKTVKKTEKIVKKVEREKIEKDVPETLQKKRKTLKIIKEKRIAKKVVLRKKEKETKVLVAQHTDKYNSNFLKVQKREIARERQAKETGNFYVKPEAKIAFVIRIGGINRVSPKVRKILQLLRLLQLHNGVFIKLNGASIRMLKLVEPYIAYGYPTRKTIKKLIYKRGYGKIEKQRIKLDSDILVEKNLKEYGCHCIEDLINEIVITGPSFKECNNFLWPFKLSAPRGGFKHKATHFNEGGDAENSSIASSTSSKSYDTTSGLLSTAPSVSIPKIPFSHTQKSTLDSPSLKNVAQFHLLCVIRRCMALFGLDSTVWETPLLELSKSGCDVMKHHGGDICDFINIKKLPGQGNCEFVKGVIFRKNISHKRMKMNITNPRIVLLDCNLDFQRVETQISSLDTLLEQERESIQIRIGKLLSLRPDILISTKHVCRIAQDLLLQAGVTLIANVKRSVLIRLARAVRGIILLSTEHVDTRATRCIGTCERFVVRCFSSKNQQTLTYSFFEGCSYGTICLREQLIPSHSNSDSYDSSTELIRAKKAFKLVLRVRYNLILETAFLQAQGMIYEDEDIRSLQKLSMLQCKLKSQSPHLLNKKNDLNPNPSQSPRSFESHKRLDAFTRLAEKHKLGEKTEGQFIYLSPLVPSGKSTILISSSPFFEDDEALLEYYQEEEKLMLSKEKPDIVAQEEDKKKQNKLLLSPRIQQLKIGAIFRLKHWNRKFDKNKDKSIYESKEESQNNSNRSNVYDITKTSNIESTQTPSLYLDTSIYKPMLMSSFVCTVCWLANGVQCCPPTTQVFSYYDQNSTLGSFLQSCFNDTLKCPAERCRKPIRDHNLSYAFGKGILTVSLAQINPLQTLPDPNLYMWIRCNKCGQVPAPCNVVSSEVTSLSFAKFLELCFCNNRAHGNCDCSASNFTVHKYRYTLFLGVKTLVVSFYYSEVKIYSLINPEAYLYVNNDKPRFSIIDREIQYNPSPCVAGTTVLIFQDEPSSIIAHVCASIEHIACISETTIDTIKQNIDNICSDSMNDSRKNILSSLLSKLFNWTPQIIRSRMLLKDDNHLKWKHTDLSTQTTFSCTVYFPKQFHALRRYYCDGDCQYIESLSRCIDFAAKGGKSGSTFAKSADERFVLKYIHKVELRMLLEYYEHYFAYITENFFNNLPSILVKILGIYKLTWSQVGGENIKGKYVTVMPNLFYGHDLPPARTFDLKGTVRNRYIFYSDETLKNKTTPIDDTPPTFNNSNYIPNKHKENGTKTSIDTSSTQSLKNSTVTSTQTSQSQQEFKEVRQEVVLLDKNLTEYTSGHPIYLSEASRDTLFKSVHNDTLFLSNLVVVDYSLLVGVDEKNDSLVLGIIDYIRQYTWDKQLETGIKSIGMIAGRSAPTIISPTNYRDRFLTAIEKYFMTASDKTLCYQTSEGCQKIL